MWLGASGLPKGNRLQLTPGASLCIPDYRYGMAIHDVTNLEEPQCALTS